MGILAFIRLLCALGSVHRRGVSTQRITHREKHARSMITMKKTLSSCLLPSTSSNSLLSNLAGVVSWHGRRIHKHEYNFRLVTKLF